MPIADYEEQIETVPAGGGSNSDLKNLPNGKYDFGITKAEFKTVAKTGSEVVDLKLEVLTDGPQSGKKYQYAYWLTNKDDGGLNEVSIGILKKDLKTLGFDVDDWKKANGRSFVVELKKALKIMGAGMAFSGTKGTNASNYATLRIDSRSPTDGKPEKFDAKSMTEMTSQPFGVDDY